MAYCCKSLCTNSAVLTRTIGLGQSWSLRDSYRVMNTQHCVTLGRILLIISQIILSAYMLKGLRLTAPTRICVRGVRIAIGIEVTRTLQLCCRIRSLPTTIPSLHHNALREVDTCRATELDGAAFSCSSHLFSRISMSLLRYPYSSLHSSRSLYDKMHSCCIQS